jgi:hypothetical protein
VLNAIAWSAKLDIPAEGIASKVTDADMQANLDPKGKPRADNREGQRDFMAALSRVRSRDTALN